MKDFIINEKNINLATIAPTEIKLRVRKIQFQSSAADVMLNGLKLTLFLLIL